MANAQFKSTKKRLSGLILIGVGGLALLISAPKGADAEGSPIQDNNGLESKAKAIESKHLVKSQIKELAGKLLIDAQLEVTQPLQVDRYVNFVAVSTPSLTPSSGHSLLWLNNTAKALCTKYDDGSTGCLGSGGGSANVVWGTIGGFLANQTDLNTVLVAVAASTAAVGVSTGSLQAQLSGLATTYLALSSATATYLQKSSATVSYCHADGTNCTASSGASLSANQTFTGFDVFSSSLAFKGSIGTDDAIAGYVGEYLSSVTGSPTAFPTSGQFGDLLTLTLTAGDWDVSGVVEITANGGSTTVWDMGISQTSGNASTGLVSGDNRLEMLPPTAASDMSLSIPGYRQKVTGSTAIYLKIVALYSVAAPKGSGRLSARRVR